MAVGAVVFHHGWPAAAPAGYMGVDVFFVVSGFLITGLLMREAERRGSLSLSNFYLRRARRILPAAVASLLAISALTLLLVPQTLWQAWFRQIVAATLYYENWQLAIDSQTPGRADLASTPVQHFWSLSVEEQFYLFWPLLIIAGLWLAGRRGAASIRTVLIVLGAVTVASFVHSIVLTGQDHNLAYFSTLSRTWEFGAGGILAIVAGNPWRDRDGLRAVVSWAGLLLIIVPIVTFRSPELFPGYVVILPVVGTMAVIWAGMPATPWSTARFAGLRPVQWVGDVSYSLYLWHWPIFMFVPYITGVPSPPWLMVLLVMFSLTVAGLSKRWIEDPFRYGQHSLHVKTAALLVGLAATISVIVGAGIVAPRVAAENSAACEQLQTQCTTD